MFNDNLTNSQIAALIIAIVFSVLTVATVFLTIKYAKKFDSFVKATCVALSAPFVAFASWLYVIFSFLDGFRGNELLNLLISIIIALILCGVIIIISKALYNKHQAEFLEEDFKKDRDENGFESEEEIENDSTPLLLENNQNENDNQDSLENSEIKEEKFEEIQEENIDLTKNEIEENDEEENTEESEENLVEDIEDNDTDLNNQEDLIENITLSKTDNQEESIEENDDSENINDIDNEDNEDDEDDKEFEEFLESLRRKAEQRKNETNDDTDSDEEN